MAFTKITAAGIGSTETVTLDGLSVINDGSFGGNVSIAGTLTYEDVTNVDSVGLITARNGIVVGSGITLSKDGDGFFTGIVTATTFSGTFSGDGTSLTGVASTDNIRTNTNATFLQNVTVVGTSTVTGNVVPSSDSATDIGTNSVRFQNAYVDTYYGDGSNLTGISVGIATTAASMSGITTVLDLSKDDFKVTASGITTVDVRGGSEGNSHMLRIVNSGITTVGFSTYFLFPSGGTPALPTADGAISLISFTVHRQGAVGLATQLLAGSSVNFS